MFKQLFFFYVFLLICLTVAVTFLPGAEDVSVGSEDMTSEKIIPDHAIQYEQDLSPDWKTNWDLARSLYHEKKYPEALVQYEILFSQKMNIDEARWEYASILMHEEKWKNARAELEKLLAAEPASIRYRSAMARVSIETGETVDVESGVELSRALLAEPLLESQKIQLLEVLVKAYDLLGRLKEEAETLEQLNTMKPLEKKMLIRLATLEVESGLMEKAAVICSGLEASMPDDNDVLLLRARIESVRGARDLAESRWLLVAENDPDNSEAHRWLSSYYFNRQEWALSLAHLEPLIKVTPNDTTLLLRAADLNVHLGRLDRALEYYDYGLAVAPFNEHIAAEKKKVQQAFAQDLLALVENEGGEKLWRDLGDITPDRVGVYREIAGLLRQQGKVESLIDVLSVLQQQVPDDLQITEELALLKEQRQDGGERLN